MNDIGIVGISLIGLNILLSINAFKNRIFFDQLRFDVYEILQKKDYKRLLTSGFIHVDTNHLVFNMLSLFFFAGLVEDFFGASRFLILYAGSLIGGSLLSLLLNRNNPEYLAVGASGAVSGVIMAAITLSPSMNIYLFFTLPIPAWLYAISFIVYSIYGIGAKRDNIGHEAHLGGAIFGILITVLFVPGLLYENTFTIIGMLIPVVGFLIIKALKIDLFNSIIPKGPKLVDKDDLYNEKRAEKMNELNVLLEKIKQNGIESLTKSERERLEELSK